ncbi:MAG: hypothetical protein DI538_17260 [Azospira oryzae]|nr:MAG: hypothetical protein DI538_17260 [Azospira oryzae]
MRKITFSDIVPHFIAFIVFLVVTFTFFSPLFFENKALDQHDIQQFLGSSKSLRDYRDANGEEGLWATNMFSGMPAYLVNLQWSDGVVVTFKKVLSVFLPHPVRNIFLAFICYYILLLAFKVRPYLAIAGALAFGLSSYLIIGQMAGHNARIGAAAFMPLVLAGIHLAFHKKRILGFGVTALGLALQLRENHLQMTYYLVLMVAVYGLIQLIAAIREKQIPEFIKTVGILIPAAVIAAATFFGQFWAITEYTRYSMRGPSELIKPGEAKGLDGLSKDYAFAYNYGVKEPMTLLIPNFYGGSSRYAFVMDPKSETYKALVNSSNNELANQLQNYSTAYWGPQSGGTLGAYYGGAIIVFLFVVGILFADQKYVWWLVPISAFALMLSWGDAFKTFNYFMFDHLPGYNKFRSVNFALIMILIAMPLLGMIGLEKVLSGELTKEAKRKLIIAVSSTAGLCLLIILFAGTSSFMREGESQLPAWFLNALRADRKSLLQNDAFRSLAFIVVVFAALFFNVHKKISANGFYAFLIIAVLIDMVVVDKRYFTKENYQRKKGSTPIEATAADQEIGKDKDYYRVYSLMGSWSSDALTSYYHQSLNGYHGAKLRRYQDLYDSCIANETNEFISDLRAGRIELEKLGVINMLNTRYFLLGPGKADVLPNESANGAAWFVNEIVLVNSANEELKKTGEIDTKKVAVVDSRQSTIDNRPLTVDSLSSITLVEHKPAQLKYESQSSADGFAVFSEIYYPKGWHATIDGKEVPILRANYVLRALPIPAGKHVIEFRFEPKPYLIGNKITWASSWILLLVVVGSIGWSLKQD